MSGNTPFPTDPALIAVAVAYTNARLIADSVLPRVPVGKKEYKYFEYDLAEGFTVPDSRVGRRSRPNEVEFSATEKTGLCADFGLDDPVPNDDIEQAPENYDPLAHSTEYTTNLIYLGREVRAAALVFNPNTYAATHRQTLSGTAQFNDFTNSDPIAVISDALDVPVMRPNVMTIGQTAWSKLSRHPDIVKAAHGNSGDKGRATREQVAELFELEELHVGQARFNTAKKGQAPNLQRCWGGHIALTYRDLTANTERGLTFGLTAQYGSWLAGSMFDKDIGLRGGQRVRVGETVEERVLANDLGYFIENAVAP